jgi:hypothetical protein
MQSSKFGVIWSSMFLVAAGFDLNPVSAKIKNPQYKSFFKSLGDVLPCFHCRKSFKIFYHELPIDDYLGKKNGLTLWVYKFKELVNNKLKNQEEEFLHDEYKKLLKKGLNPNSKEFWKTFRQTAHDTCYTKNTPHFKNVVEELNKLKADCSKEKHCRTPLKKSFRKKTTRSLK